MEFILHLGPHRTATTAFQQTCRSNELVLAENHVDFWGPEIMREPQIARYVQVARKARHNEEAMVSAARTRQIIWDAMEARRTEGVKQVIVSEENIVGTMVNNLATHRFYPRAAERLPYYRDMFPQQPERIFLCLRSYADYWVSAYSYAALKNEVPDWNKISGYLANSSRGWFDLTEEVSETFPDSDIMVWRYDRDVAVIKGLFQEMLGRELAEELAFQKEPVNERLSAAQVRIGQRLRRENPQIDTKSLLEKLKEIAPGDQEPMRGFDDDQKAHLDERFVEDWQSLENGAFGNVTLFDPTSDEAGRLR